MANQSRLWRKLGTVGGQAVQIAQFYAQKSSLAARKMLEPQELLIDDFSHGSRERRPFDQRSIVHLAVG
jgi:hypothetical protein